jgi:hypothetical protein
MKGLTLKMIYFQVNSDCEMAVNNSEDSVYLSSALTLLNPIAK